MIQDYKEAAKLLMERNMPEILHDRQQEALFVPETHLPSRPRVVDVSRFGERKRKIDSMGPAALQLVDMKLSQQGEPEEMSHVKGDLAEKELVDELKRLLTTDGCDKEMVVYQGPSIRKPRKSKAFDQENDVVIIRKNTKTIYNIESKARLAKRPGNKAVKQIQELKKILEEFFAPEFAAGDWCFAGMMYTQEINPNNNICSDCSQFIIQRTAEVATKLNNVEAHLNTVRPQQVASSHLEYVSLVQGFSFVVLSRPISTFCTISKDLHDAVVGKTGAEAGQGDFQSIIFWTNEQAMIMLTALQFVFFISPWSTGKTICMREKAVMWATQNPTKNLVFVVVRREYVKQTSLLEMELKDFFHHQHNLQHVIVLGLPSLPELTLRNLLEVVITWPPSGWMVDELIMPSSLHHQQFTKELRQLQNHFEVQPGKPPLWIACAGIKDGKAEQFERSYMASILPPAFHLPEMSMPLRNTKKTLAMAGLEGNKNVKEFDYFGSFSIQTNPVYKVPEHLITGVAGKEFHVKNKGDKEEVVRVVKEACEEVFRRTGGAGFPLLCNDSIGTTIHTIKGGIERAGATALVYKLTRMYDNVTKRMTTSSQVYDGCCSEAEVEDWLRRRRSMEAKIVLFADTDVSRGWEASHVLVIDFGGRSGLENLVMRTVGYCAIVK